MSKYLEPITEVSINSRAGYMSTETITYKENINEIRELLHEHYALTSYTRIAQYDYANIDRIINFFSQLEELILTMYHKQDEPHTYNYICVDDIHPIINLALNFKGRTGVIGMIGQAMSDDIIKNTLKDYNVKIDRLTALEEYFANEGKENITIFTIPEHNKIFFQARTMLTIKEYAELKILQWTLFKDNIDGYDEKILNIYTALKAADFNKINNIINDIEKTDEMIREIKNRISSLFAIDYENKKHMIRSRIATHYENIENYKRNCLEQIMEIQKKNKELKLIEIEEKEQKSNEFLAENIIYSPYIDKIKEVDENIISITYKAPMVYYSKFIIEDIINSYEGPKREILQLFLNEEYELMVTAKLKFNKMNFQTTTTSAPESEHHFPHPHINRWGCLGNHTDAIYESAESGDFIGAIEQITQAVLNLNFTDGTVVNEMLDDLIYRVPQKEVWRKKGTEEYYATKDIIDMSY